jgi:hypothetical protein
MVEDRVASRRIIFVSLIPDDTAHGLDTSAGPTLQTRTGRIGLDSGAVMPISDRTPFVIKRRENRAMSDILIRIVARGHRPPSGPCPLPDAPMGIVESYRAARRNLLEIIPRRALHQPVISGHTGPQRWHMLMDPPAIRRVMLEAVEDYPKSVATRAVLQPAIGDSLFLAEGDHWRWQRRATAPAFSARSIDALTPVMTRAAEAAAERLERCPSGGPPTWSNT